MWYNSQIQGAVRRFWKKNLYPTSILVELINLVKSYNFSISIDLTQMVNFPTQIPDFDSHSPVLLDFFLSSDASICSTMAFPLLGNSDYIFVSVSIYFPLNSTQDVLIHYVAYDFSCLLGWPLWSFERSSMGGYL